MGSPSATKGSLSLFRLRSAVRVTLRTMARTATIAKENTTTCWRITNWFKKSQVFHIGKLSITYPKLVHIAIVNDYVSSSSFIIFSSYLFQTFGNWLSSFLKLYILQEMLRCGLCYCAPLNAVACCSELAALAATFTTARSPLCGRREQQEKTFLAFQNLTCFRHVLACRDCSWV